MFWVPIWLPEMKNPRLTRVLSLKSTPGGTQQVKSDGNRLEFYINCLCSRLCSIILK